ncbi:unnamed protein product, partial [Brassica oleracea var. botrytis]
CDDLPHPLHLVSSDKQQKDHKTDPCLRAINPHHSSHLFIPFVIEDSYQPVFSQVLFKYQTMVCDSVIDLGLSLRTIQHEPYHTSGQSVGEYREVTDELKSNRGEFLQKKHEARNGRCGKECWSNEGGRKKWGYVKVTMDGFVVGRKVCVLDHGGHSTLAHQLEDMFGMQSVTGLRLFERESEFSLVYKDKEGTWRNAEDVSWKELVENVERLRITRRNDFLLFF